VVQRSSNVREFHKFPLPGEVSWRRPARCFGTTMLSSADWCCLRCLPGTARARGAPAVRWGLEIVTRRQEQNTCVVLSRRWVVKRTFAWPLDPHLHHSPHGPGAMPDNFIHSLFGAELILSACSARFRRSTFLTCSATTSQHVQDHDETLLSHIASRHLSTFYRMSR
jgi:hypothetical protein